MFKKKKENLTNIDELTDIKINKSFKEIKKKDSKVKKEKTVKIKKEKIREKEDFKGFFKLTFLRCLAKTIDICSIWILMSILIIGYTTYAFNKIKNYIIKVYTESANTYNVSKEIIDERQFELENVKTFYTLVKTLLKYDTFDAAITVYGIFFLGGYVTFYFISMFLIEILFVNKKGQTIGKKICNLRLIKGRRWWELITRSVIIYFATFFLMISYFLKFRKRRAMAHEHLLNNYVILNYDYKEDDGNNVSKDSHK